MQYRESEKPNIASDSFLINVGGLHSIRAIQAKYFGLTRQIYRIHLFKMQRYIKQDITIVHLNPATNGLKTG